MTTGMLVVIMTLLFCFVMLGAFTAGRASMRRERDAAERARAAKDHVVRVPSFGFKGVVESLTHRGSSVIAELRMEGLHGNVKLDLRNQRVIERFRDACAKQETLHFVTPLDPQQAATKEEVT